MTLYGQIGMYFCSYGRYCGVPMTKPTRRAVLSALGVLGLGGAGLSASAQQNGGPNQQGGNDDLEVIVLCAGTPGWFGLAPPGIRDQRNPTLRLRAGQEYELVWINSDGQEYELVIADGAGEDLVETPSTERRGVATRTVFRADPRMSTYYCYYHPQAMRGTIEVSQ